MQQTLNNKYEKYRLLNKDQLIDKLLKTTQKTTKLKVKVKSLKQNNQALAVKLQKKKESQEDYHSLLEKYH